MVLWFWVVVVFAPVYGSVVITLMKFGLNLTVNCGTDGVGMVIAVRAGVGV